VTGFRESWEDEQILFRSRLRRLANQGVTPAFLYLS
jgi:hypothetical protein